ncbi:BLOC-2 complex member HPS6 [Lampris incognitus]|uniref:BLOC-2 complex member HPS6 n=1 Tax=Lampris incognitus TaxID=2546036 RepID=UPI0024B5D737|nr:BLOC-2 complex member HPS6 [Lampris incognitus]
MTRLAPERLTDFGDYVRGKELSEFLRQSDPDADGGNGLSDVRVSPDGRHIHAILRPPKVGLVTFDKYERPQLIRNQRHLDARVSRTVPVVDVVYLECNKNSGGGGGGRDPGVAVVVVVNENGKAEFWRFQECREGWHLLQTSDLCNSPRARVVSVSTCSNVIIWCEERPQSESSPAARNNFRYCICKRAYEVEEGSVRLGGVKIALHNNPCFTVISSADCVYLLPDSKENLLLSISKFFLFWSPQHDTFRVNSTCQGALLRKNSPSAKESDFKRLVTDCLGYISSLDPPEIFGSSPAACGGLLLLLSTGWVSLLQRDGTLRQVYKLADNFSVNSSTHNSLHMYQDTLALTVGRVLYLIDLKCGRELQKICLKRESLLYVNGAEKQAPHLLSEMGMFVVAPRESDTKLNFSFLDTAGGICPGALLVEAVFEEACKYYQQRSLSSTQLTVDKLKKGGMFQAPIALASILRDYLSRGGRLKGAELPQRGEDSMRQDKLLGFLEMELKALISLEEVKVSLVRSSEKELQMTCESLVQMEVARLLSSSELDREALLYLNSIFTTFPHQAWRATRAALQLHRNGEGSLSSTARPEVWKTVLSPVPIHSAQASAPQSNGQPKQKLSFRANPIPNSIAEAPRPMFLAVNLALPLFELLCHSVLQFQPGWLPGFLELAQQQQGSAGLGLSLSSPSWSYSGGRGGEGGENSTPLYKRAMSVLPGPDTDQNRDLEVELLLVSGRPNAILQALRILMSQRQWERVTTVAQTFCKQSPLLNKEIFTTLLCEVAHHRDLDPYLDLLWALCPEDLTVTTILNLVLQKIPSPNPPPPLASSSSPLSSYSSFPAPFAESQGSSQLTIGLLKPLLRKVLQRETKLSQRYADILQSPIFPPPPLPRAPAEQPRVGGEPSADNSINLTALTDPHGREPSKHETIQGGRTSLSANPV